MTCATPPFEDGARRPFGCFPRGRCHVDRAELDPDLAWRSIEIWFVRSVMPANLKPVAFCLNLTRPSLGVMGRSKRDAEGIVRNGEWLRLVVRFPNIWVLQIQCFNLIDQLASDQP